MGPQIQNKQPEEHDKKTVDGLKGPSHSGGEQFNYGSVWLSQFSLLAKHKPVTIVILEAFKLLFL